MQDFYDDDIGFSPEEIISGKKKRSTLDDIEARAEADEEDFYAGSSHW